jgi:ABC-type branched-subunit amino acid transport system ATPase component
VENVLKVEALTKTFGGLTAVRSVDAHFEAGKISAIIGPNGAGKTTFFNLISGAIPPTSGSSLPDNLKAADITGIDERGGMMSRIIIAAVENGKITPLSIDELSH